MYWCDSVEYASWEWYGLSSWDVQQWRCSVSMFHFTDTSNGKPLGLLPPGARFIESLWGFQASCCQRKASTSTCYRSCMIKKGRCLALLRHWMMMCHHETKIWRLNLTTIIQLGYRLLAIVIMPMMVLVIKHTFFSMYLVPLSQGANARGKTKNMSTKRIIFAAVSYFQFAWRLSWFKNSIDSKIRNIMEHPLRRIDVQCKE